MCLVLQKYIAYAVMFVSLSVFVVSFRSLVVGWWLVVGGRLVDVGGWLVVFGRRAVLLVPVVTAPDE